MSKFIKVMPRILWTLFFSIFAGHGVHIFICQDGSEQKHTQTQ